MSTRLFGMCIRCQRRLMIDTGTQLCASCEPTQAGPELVLRGGARRKSRKPLYHKVPLELLEEVGNAREGGDLKYEPDNWKQGDRAFYVDCINHTIEHVMKAGDADPTGDDVEDLVTHLGHAATNIAFMLWAIKRGKLRREDFRDAAVIMQEAEAANG